MSSTQHSPHPQETTGRCQVDVVSLLSGSSRMDLVVIAIGGFWRALHLRLEVSRDVMRYLRSVSPVKGCRVDDMAV